MLYRYDKKEFDAIEIFRDNTIIQKLYDEDSSTAYYLTTVFKKRLDGGYQYPFVHRLHPNNKSIYDMVLQEGWLLGINAGNNTQYVVENGKLLSNADHVPSRPPLIIYSDGTLDSIDDMPGNEAVVPEGVISGVLGWVPLVKNYESREDYDQYIIDEGYETVITESAQRQIIGQYGNGDYAIITSEGRDYENSKGFTFAEARAVCLKHNLKFAYMLDGGGSVQTVLGKKNINIVYEGQTGREIMVAIGFNGWSTYKLPNN